MSDRQASLSPTARQIGQIGEIDRKLAKIQTTLDKKTAAAKDKAESDAAPLIAEREKLVAKVETYCTGKRDELTENGRRKFADFPTGRVGWRKGRPSVDYPKDDAERIIAALKKGGLKRLVRVTESVNVKAILDAGEKVQAKVTAIEGVTLVPAGESFYVDPVQLELANRSKGAAK